MKYYSLNHNSKPCSFADAVKKGLAPDRGLYFPEKIPILPKKFFKEIQDQSIPEMAFKVIKPFIGKQINNNKLLEIVKETLDFKFPVVEITNNIAALELFQGPTLAFKDVGARFMARTLGYLKKGSKEKITVMVATSGDTGGAVANGFLGVEGVKVVILYPKGKVSEIQEKQLTTLGQNITALEVDGVFDDCQEMVKNAFLDTSLSSVQLTSANSINIGRWLPQMFYYFIAYRALKNKNKNLVFSVPSGNFGNICAGIMSQQMGLPVSHFIASTNVNDTVPRYLKTANYEPLPTKQTISNAMDVGDPSNFIRIQKIFNNDIYRMKKKFSGYSYTDDQTKKALKKIYSKKKYIADPHGAVGYLGLQEYISTQKDDLYGVFLETAHPVKFKNTVEKVLNLKVPIPNRLKETLSKKKVSIPIRDYNELRSYLLD
ncbi:MAG: threonine synthase [Flavobacteriaceae bacterium]|nr:threonine synthase [Flavobacteriaceae bacterium]|tara:strand:+ start:10179 stop:11471 length:1293 start_codon:yes stop_codon:yes gene_type:complete